MLQSPCCSSAFSWLWTTYLSQVSRLILLEVAPVFTTTPSCGHDAIFYQVVLPERTSPTKTQTACRLRSSYPVLNIIFTLFWRPFCPTRPVSIVFWFSPPNSPRTHPRAPPIYITSEALLHLNSFTSIPTGNTHYQSSRRQLHVTGDATCTYAPSLLSSLGPCFPHKPGPACLLPKSWRFQSSCLLFCCCPPPLPDPLSHTLPTQIPASGCHYDAGQHHHHHHCHWHTHSKSESHVCYPPSGMCDHVFPHALMEPITDRYSCSAAYLGSTMNVMGGAGKRRAHVEQQSSSTGGSSRASTARTPKSISRLDGNRDPDSYRAPIEYSNEKDLKNLSDFLGLKGWYIARGKPLPQNLPQRPAEFNKLGKEALVTLNTFNVAQFPTQTVYQYDIECSKKIDPKDLKEFKGLRGLLKKLWNSKTAKEQLGEPHHLWIYDGNKLAWSTRNFDRDETRITVNLDDPKNCGKARKPRDDGKENIHTLFIRKTRKVDFASLRSFLDRGSDWTPTCIDTINFLDHLMREGPAQKYTQIKKSFFQRGENRFDLGGGVEAFKGVFSSLRPVLNDNFQKSLSVNVDVANGTFWRPQELGRALLQAFNCTQPQLAQRFREAKQDWKKSTFRRDLRRFKHVGITSIHGTPQQWTIDEFVPMDVNDAKFEDPDGRQISLMQYFQQKYGKNLAPGFPVVKVTKKIRRKDVYLPLDVLRIDPNQRYNTKLSDQQTSAMIKFAVTLPEGRWRDINNGVRLLDWQKDSYLTHYGLKIDPKPATVKARVLPPPIVNFGPCRDAKLKDQDMLNGRWRLDGRKFALANQKEVKAWGVCCIMPTRRNDPGLSKDVVGKFFSEFIKTYEGHGGRFAVHPKYGKLPWFGQGSLADGGALVEKAYNATGNQFNTTPSLLFFIVNDRNTEVYRRLKKSLDCRYGIASQVLQSKHVQSCSGQYISNVCMKVNAKLGGTTTWVQSSVIPKMNPAFASTSTMVVGADVSHPAPGAGSGEASSIAAITVSQDARFTRYWAEVQTNGNRIEMITTKNIENHFTPMVKNWMQRAGNGHPPKHVMYIRDGVSEGQYAAVLEDEVTDMKKAFKALGARDCPKFIVMIAGKRHHIRFFPQKGDRNKNALPGTLVESGCTHPFEFDFYMCSHVAIKGTARPIHYACILNEAEWDSRQIQQFIFEHAYSYVRSTTPVSLHPAVYYAHLAADRARAHLNENPVSSGKKESKPPEAQSSTGSTGKREVNVAPLIKMGNGGHKEFMWFV
ncbi:unnamed protein product [Periconia digitata]|uniref:Piwi-domain-containing protein n=1 Tax=Periconia digitata TaxID=1303443 RepID=A0A9W4UQP7_9PLEO|nr:unnamed protein product [Periconia digitata]